MTAIEYVGEMTHTLLASGEPRGPCSSIVYATAIVCSVLPKPICRGDSAHVEWWVGARVLGSGWWQRLAHIVRKDRAPPELVLAHQRIEEKAHPLHLVLAQLGGELWIHDDMHLSIALLGWR
jgi:hypothetical protein